MNSDPSTFLLETWMTVVRRNWLGLAIFFTYIAGASILISPGLTTHAANAALIWNTPNQTAMISYAHSACPSVGGAGVPVTSDTVSLIASQKMAQQWQLAEGANYAHRSGGSEPTAIMFHIHPATVDVYYFVTRIWPTVLCFDYINFNQEF